MGLLVVAVIFLILDLDRPEQRADCQQSTAND
jgi:hypothetical protein